MSAALYIFGFFAIVALVIIGAVLRTMHRQADDSEPPHEYEPDNDPTGNW